MLQADQQRRQPAQTIEMNQTMLHFKTPKLEIQKAENGNADMDYGPQTARPWTQLKTG
jgi:hypothetical protein